MQYYGIEEALTQLKLNHKYKSGEWLIHVYYIPGTPCLNYEIIEQSGYTPGHSYKDLGKAIQYILRTVEERDQAWLGYHNDQLYSFVPEQEVGLVYFGEVTFIKEPKDKRKNKRVPILEFEDGTICRTVPEYLDYFHLEDTYINRGKLLNFFKQCEEDRKNERLLRNRKRKFDKTKVIKFEMGENTFGKPVGVLSYKGLPNMAGFGPIIKNFPDLTREQAMELYNSHNIPVPSTMKKYFTQKVGEKATKGAKVPRELPYFVEKYKLSKRSDGSMNFLSSIGEMVAQDSAKLCECLRSEGETITQREAATLWKEVME